MDGFPATSLSNDAVKARISATEAKIRHLRAQINQLMSELQKEQRTLGKLWFMVVPIGTLPTELLLEVFSLAVGSECDDADAAETDILTTGVNRALHQALLLSHVCSAWRQIAVCSPHFWAERMVDVRMDRKNNLDVLRMLFDRSAPLSISVSLTHGSPMFRTHSPTPSSVAIAQAIAPTALRWKYLKLDKSSFETVKRIFSGPFTALEVLDIQFAVNLQSTPIQLFSECSHLRSLTIKSDSMMSSHSLDRSLRMPWAQLTSLDLMEYNPLACRSILLQCRNIISVMLTTSEWNSSAVDVPSTTLLFLETLEMRFEDGGEDIGRVEPFFTPLCLPTLHGVGLAFDDHRSTVWPGPEFSAFQTRAPHVTRITLNQCPITSPELITLLLLAPELKALTLGVCPNCIDDDFLHALTYQETSAQQLGPQLQELHWRYVGVLRSDLFEAAVRSRCWTANTAPPHFRKLKKITINEESFLAAPLPYNWMQDLIEQGLELTCLS
ncbi:F-box domain-containing protein [Mycena venus]|uniref:F-box domain-containing protein n=1 Tax=Mycena venus TaxID=2733690 RepID=A0A8H7D179_9AGAR|nr:F-box domain-containing protein [Mycena venus]